MLSSYMTLHVKVNQRLLSTRASTVHYMYTCETKKMKAVDKTLQHFEMTTYQQLLRASWTVHWTNASVLQWQCWVDWKRCIKWYV